MLTAMPKLRPAVAEAVVPALNQLEGPRERLIRAALSGSPGEGLEPGDALPFPSELGVPTMLSPRELNYLHWLGSLVREGGRVVELGCFLGGSTAALVEGMRRSGRLHPRVLVYDGFIAPESEAIVNSWWMQPYGLRAGENFRAKYEALHVRRLDRLMIREGWIPEAVDAAGERALYPEQEPIDVLFVDAAKSWGVHCSILRAFARHMKIGSVLVQQDFMDAGTPWLPIHMWQLRDVFRPLDLVKAAPTMSFECIADPSARVDQVWRELVFASPGERARAWEQVIGYWGEILGDRAAGFVHGHAMRHAHYVGDGEAMVRYGRAHAAWSSSADCRGCYVTPMWEDWLRAAPAGAGRAARAAGLQRDLAAEIQVRRALQAAVPVPESVEFVPYELRRWRWERARKRLNAAGHTRVALYGAGAHTEWLLGEGWGRGGSWGSAEIAVAFIIDDAPRVSAIAGVPVVRTAEFASRRGEVGAVLPSSDAHEGRLLERARSADWPGAGVPVFAVYTEGLSDEWVPASPWATTGGTAANEAILTRPSPTSFEARAEHRAGLGLSVERGWLEEFARRAVAPAWVKGHVNFRDSLFMWDLVEAARPRRIVEMGTAAGISTSSLAAAGDFFRPAGAKRTEVHSFDLVRDCYFDRSRRVGAAVVECVPDLLDRVHLHPGLIAVQAARHFSPGTVDLAFIDGDHRHPAPTLDVLALLYAIRPGAWVILHDIKLTEASKATRGADWQLEIGAELLFKRWPYEKIQPGFPEPWKNNIGAIRLPMDPADCVGFLLDLLNEPWECGRDVYPGIAEALALRGSA